MHGTRIKVVAFNGSARRGGNTAILLGHVLGELEKEGIGTELVELGGAHIHGCLACRKCSARKDGRCSQEDDMGNVYIEKMAAADGILLGSPTYVADISPEIKALIDRACLVSGANGGMFRRKAGAAVVATHIRLAPRVADPDPHYDDVVAEVAAFLAERAERALAAGVGADRIVVDAGLDLGKTAEQSLALLRASDTLSGLGYPLLLSASNKTFLGVLYDLAIGERREASLIAAALGTTLGCRILRVHDVAGTRRVAEVLAAISAAR